MPLQVMEFSTLNLSHGQDLLYSASQFWFASPTKLSNLVRCGIPDDAPGGGERGRVEGGFPG